VGFWGFGEQYVTEPRTSKNITIAPKTPKPHQELVINMVEQAICVQKIDPDLFKGNPKEIQDFICVICM